LRALHSFPTRRSSDLHAGVIPEERSFATRVLRGKALREHHVDAGDVHAAAGKEEGETDVEQRERAHRNAPATDDLQRHAPDEQIDRKSTRLNSSHVAI